MTFTVITASTSNPALAEEADGTSPTESREQPTDHCLDKKDDSGPDMTMMTGKEKTDQVNALHTAIDGGEVSVQSAETAWALGEEKVYEFEADGATFRLAVLPLNEPYSLTSNFAVLFDEEREIVQYTETLISENDDKNFNISTFVEGELTNSHDTDVPHMPDTEIMAGDNGTPPSDSETPPTLEAQQKNTKACVATILGISTFFAGVIVAACAGSCGIPIAGTPICIGCIAGFATVGAGTLGAVATCF